MSKKADLPAPLSTRTDIRLHDNGLQAGRLIEGLVPRLPPQDIQGLARKAAEASLRLEEKRLGYELDHDHARQRIRDHIEGIERRERSRGMTRTCISEEIYLGAGRVQIHSATGPTCFIATATYGNADHPDVAFLRLFRDQVLSRSAGGRRFIAWYWSHGPALAARVAERPLARRVTRMGIGALVLGLRLAWAAQPTGFRGPSGR